MTTCDTCGSTQLKFFKQHGYQCLSCGFGGNFRPLLPTEPPKPKCSKCNQLLTQFFHNNIPQDRLICITCSKTYPMTNTQPNSPLLPVTKQCAKCKEIELHTPDSEKCHCGGNLFLYHDPVDHPSHYTQGGIECIDAIKAALTPEEFRGFLKGNTIKYLWRMNHKNSPSEDAGKAQWYLDRLNKELKK